MIFQKFGRSFVKGAKAEILEPSTQPLIDWDRALKVVACIAEVGMFAISLFVGRGPKKAQTTTVVVNNYIGKEK